MSDTLDSDDLIRDLAIVLRNALHPNAKLGPSGHRAAARLRDALGIADGETTDATVAKIAGALTESAAEESRP